MTFFLLWKQVNTSLSQTMTNVVLVLHMVAVLKIFPTKRHPRPQAVLSLLSAVLALFTLPYFTCKGLCDLFHRKTCCNQTNPLHGWTWPLRIALYSQTVHVDLMWPDKELSTWAVGGWGSWSSWYKILCVFPGLLKFCTVGFCGIGSLVDFILISMQVCLTYSWFLFTADNSDCSS